MGIFAWIILGALSGWIASIIMNKNHKMGALANIITGIIGANIGGFVFNMIGGGDVTGLNLYSVVVSVVGACILLWIIGLVKK